MCDREVIKGKDEDYRKFESPVQGSKLANGRMDKDRLKHPKSEE